MRIIAFITEAGSIHRILDTSVSPPIPAHRPPEVRPMGRGTSIHAKEACRVDRFCGVQS